MTYQVVPHPWESGWLTILSPTGEYVQQGATAKKPSFTRNTKKAVAIKSPKGAERLAEGIASTRLL